VHGPRIYRSILQPSSPTGCPSGGIPRILGIVHGRDDDYYDNSNNDNGKTGWQDGQDKSECCSVVGSARMRRVT
jgi:hypothetical protein